MTAKVPLKVHLRLRFQNPGKPRTAGLCGRAAGACDCGPLSCAKIERPSPLEKPSCKVQLFAQNRSRNYRQKVTATTPSQTAFHRIFQPLAQTAHVRFHERKWVHTRLSEKDRTQRHTRRNRGLPDVDAITTLGAFRTFTNIPGPGIRTAHFAVFGSWPGGLPKNAESLRDSDVLMRVAVPRRRGPAGLRDLFLLLSELRLARPVLRDFPRVRDEGGYHYPRCALRAAETLDGRLSKGLICRFLRSDSHHWFQRCKMCPAFYKNSSSSRQTAPVPCERDRSCFFRHFKERARNAAIWARVLVELGSKRPPPTPVVTPFSTAQDTAPA